MVTEELMLLASAAAQTVVTAASTDAWGTAKKGLARLLGTGDAGQAAAAERRLEETCGDLAGLSGAVLMARRAELAGGVTSRNGADF